MKKLIVPALFTLSIASNAYAATELNPANKMSEIEKQSYSAGFAQGSQLKKMDSDLNINFKMDYFKQGFDDAYAEQKAAVDEKSMEDSLVALQKTLMEKQRTFLDKQFKENKSKGEEFLAKVKKDNPKKVKELSDGILYEVIKTGKSKQQPTLTDTVKVSYKGATIDGKEFDSNQNIELGLNGLIKGWQTALQKMHPGDHWKLYIPADQAYGERGTPGIMPNSTLVFDIELHDIVKAADASNKKS